MNNDFIIIQNNISKNEENLGRLGLIKCTNGEIKTPAFIFCGTKGAIKGVELGEIDKSTQILLCNTFHLNAISENVHNAGGIHKFIGWNKPIITDSGGFQIFSLGNGYISDEIKGKLNRKTNFVKIKENGCEFKNPINGDICFLSPEKSIEIQINLGVDFVVCFDECTTSHHSYEYTKESMHRSHKWEDICLEYFNKNKKPHQSLYGIIQGGIYEDLREESINFIKERDFFGVCIGGCLGKTKEEMYNIVKSTSLKLNSQKPVHLLGIGRVEDILALCEYVDTFDCVEPTRIARHGVAIIPKYRLNLRNAKFYNDFSPLDNECGCTTCSRYSRAYLHYLLKAKELSYMALIVKHNIFTMNKLMEEIREAMKNGNLDLVKQKWLL